LCSRRRSRRRCSMPGLVFGRVGSSASAGCLRVPRHWARACSKISFRVPRLHRVSRAVLGESEYEK
jgi:hypothetical protein